MLGRGRGGRRPEHPDAGPERTGTDADATGSADDAAIAPDAATAPDAAPAPDDAPAPEPAPEPAVAAEPEPAPAEDAPRQDDGAASSRSRSPAEAFADLTRAVNVMSADVRQIADFVRQATPNAALSVERARRSGESSGLDAVIRIHEALFTLIQARAVAVAADAAADPATDEVLTVLREVRGTVEDALRGFEVEVREPAVRQRAESSWMAAVASDPPAGPDDLPGTVSRVASCAYVLVRDQGMKVINAATVSVFSEAPDPAGSQA